MVRKSGPASGPASQTRWTPEDEQVLLSTFEEVRESMRRRRSTKNGYAEMWKEVHKRSKLGRSVRALQARYHSIKKRTSSEKTDETSSPGGQQSAGDPANDALDEDLGAKLAGVAVKTERLAWSSKGVGDVRNRQEAQETKSAVRETRSDAQETKSEAQETKSDAQHEGGLDETASSEDSDSGSDDSDTSSDDSDSSSDEDEVDEDKKDAEVLTPRKVKKEAQARGKIRGSAKPTSKLARADKKRAMALEAMNTEKLCRWLKTTCELWSAVDAFSENAINGEILAALDDKTLKGQLGLKPLQIRRLRLEIRKLP